MQRTYMYIKEEHFSLTKNLAALQRPIMKSLKGRDGGGGGGRNVIVDKQKFVYPTLHEKNQNEANSQSHMVCRLITQNSYCIISTNSLSLYFCIIKHNIICYKEAWAYALNPPPCCCMD